MLLRRWMHVTSSIYCFICVCMAPAFTTFNFYDTHRISSEHLSKMNSAQAMFASNVFHAQFWRICTIAHDNSRDAITKHIAILWTVLPFHLCLPVNFPTNERHRVMHFLHRLLFVRIFITVFVAHSALHMFSIVLSANHNLIWNAKRTYAQLV